MISLQQIPLSTVLLFGFTTLLTISFFCKAASYSKLVIAILGSVLIIQTFVSLTGFYTVTDSVPPRFIFLLLPSLLIILLLFVLKKGRKFLDGLELKTLTILHMIRIPVELVLYSLFLHHTVPEIMTFDGRNFDIISGITAPVMYYFAFVKKQIGKNLLLLWNVVCLALLINIVTHAVLAAPFPFQQLAFDQPNIAVLYFPFALLPAVVVPLVLLSHLASIRKLLSKNKFN